jgi:hypothetical protein
MMPGKEDSTRCTAAETLAEGPAAEGTGDAAQQLPQVPQGRFSAIMGERRLHVVRNEADGKGNLSRPAPCPGRPGMLDRALLERIGAILRDSFADIEQEPLPERLSKLVEALRTQEKHR